MMMTDPNDDFLDDLFATARRGDPVPGDDLVTRILADSDAVQDSWATPATPTVELGLWARMLDVIGGWPALGGLAAATIAGVWVGIAPPAGVTDLTAGIWGEAVTVPLTSTDLGFDAGTFADG